MANASLLTEPISHWQFSKLIIACTEYLLIIFHLRKELLKWRHADLQTLFFFENVKLLIGKTHLAWKVSRKLFCESTINWLFFSWFCISICVSWKISKSANMKTQHVCDGIPWLQLAIQLVGHREPGLTIWTVHQPTVECRPVCEVYLQIGVLLQTLLVFFKTLGKKSQTIIILFNLGFTSLGISFKEKPHFFQTSPTLELYVEI